VRPEHVNLGLGQLKAKILLIEDLGHEMQIILSIGNANIIVRAPIQNKYSIKDELLFSLNEENIHLFDIRSGNNIGNLEEINA
jgi:ABC-type sugar transport system ATPase subunit